MASVLASSYYFKKLDDGTFIIAQEQPISPTWVVVDEDKPKPRPSPLKLDAVTMNEKKVKPIIKLISHEDYLDILQEQIKECGCEYCDTCEFYCHYCDCCENCGYYINYCTCGFNSPSYEVLDNNETFYEDDYNLKLVKCLDNNFNKGDKSRTSIRNNRDVYRLLETPRHDTKQKDKRERYLKRSQRQIEHNNKSLFSSKLNVCKQLQLVSTPNAYTDN